MSNEAAGPWPSWDELFGAPPGETPPGTGTRPVPGEMPNYLQRRVNPGAGLGSGYSDVRPDDALGWNVGGQPDRAPAPDPLMAPAGMVANPYYYLPGNAEYIPQAQYDELMAVSAGPQYDAYDAMYQTKGNVKYVEPDPTKPVDPWQRENDYYDALKARSDLSRVTAGNYQETGMEYVDGVGYVPWTEYVTGKYGTVSAQEFKNGPDAFNISGLPHGVDTRVGNYYQPDGSVAYQGPIRPPALMPTNVSTPTGDVQGYMSADFFIGGVPSKYRRGGSVGPVDWALSNDVSRSQPRANAFGDKGFYGAPGGVVGPDDPAYEILRGVSPSQVKLSNDVMTTDPNPFRGNPGTTSRFIAEEGDSPKVYPGVSFYEVGPDGQLKKVTALTSGKEYFAVRENYDFEGFAENPTMKNADPGTVFQIRTGNSVNGTKVSSFSKDYNILSIYDPETREKYTLADIESGAHGYEPGVIPGGWGVVMSKTGTPVEEAIVAGEDNMGVAAAAYNMEGPESVAAMMQTGIGKRFTEAGFSVGSDGLLVRQAPAISTEPPPVTTVDDSPTPPPSGPTSPADFQTQMKTYIGGSLRSVTEGRVTFVPGENRSSYPTYAGTPYEDIGGKGWVVPVAASTTGASIAELKDMGAAVYKNNGIDEKTGLVDWVSVSSGDIKEGVEYVMVFTNSEVRTLLGVK